MPNQKQIITFASGYAKSKGESAYPYLWDGLVGAWNPSIGKQGLTLFDLSPYSRNAAITNFASGELYTPGLQGYSVDYKDTMFANIGNIPQIDDATQDLAISIWIKTDIAQTNHAIFYYDTNDSLSPTTDFYCMFKTNLTLGGIGQSGEINTSYASSNFQDGEWHHLVVVLKNTNLLVYDNGVEVANIGVSHSRADYGATHNFRIADDANVDDYIGLVGDCLVYNRALESSEVTDLYIGNSFLTEVFPIPMSTALTLALEDINLDIRARFEESLNDIDLDIRTLKEELADADLDIRAKFPTAFVDTNLDIRALAPVFADTNLDIRAIDQVTKDVNLDIRTLLTVTKDVDLDIRTIFGNFSDISLDIRASQITDTSQVQSSGSMFFEEGFYLATNTVTIDLEGAKGAVKMQFRNENEAIFSILEPYNGTKENFQLSPGDGDKTVFIRFVDIQGKLSTGSDFIDAIVDTSTPPSVTIEAFTDQSATTPIIDSTYQSDNTPFFRWTIPIFDIPYDGFSYALDETPTDDIDIFITDIVRDGIEVTKATPAPEMTVETSTGSYYYTSELRDYTIQSVTLDDGGVLDRIDVIYLSGGFGTLNILKGIESVTPAPPDIPSDAPDAIILAEALVPAGTTLIANVTLTDKRQTFIEVTEFLKEPISLGEHEFNVKAIVRTGLISNVSTFNLFISNTSPEMGTIDGFTDITETFSIQSGIYQTASDTPFFKWTAAPAEPVPIEYHYTTDGSEPTLASPFTTSTSILLGPFSEGITIIKIKPFDTTSGFSGQTQEFIFVFGTATFTDDTAVIGNTSTLKQSEKEIQVKEIFWDFNSARTCKIFQPAEFDDNLPFSEGETISVVHGSANTTVFTGRIIQIERIINISKEGVMYHCVGSRGLLNECYAVINDPNDPLVGDTAQIIFEDEPIQDAINTIISKVPNIIKSVDSLPTGANITDEFVAQTISQVLDGLYARTKFGWYMKPEGTLVSVDSTAIDSGEAKFGIYGVTVSSLSPQFNVMSSDLQFSATRRYKTAIIEGARRRERIIVGAHCAGNKLLSEILDEGERDANARFKIYEIDSDLPVVKIISTSVSYSRLLGFQQIPQGAGGRLGFGDSISSWYIKFLKTEIARDNIITIRERESFENIVLVPGSISKENPDGDTVSLAAGLSTYRTRTAEVPQGTLGPRNTIRFSRPLWSLWPKGQHNATTVNGITVRNHQELKAFGDTYAISNTWQGVPVQTCATVTADVLVETFPLKATVSVAGSSSTNKILRIVREEFKFDEDPDNFRDDTAQMIQYATDSLQKFKDIKINGLIILDTIDLFWDLDKTVNLINTQQGSW